jgi:hypothetical protein
VADHVPVLDAVVAAIAVVLLPSYSLTVDAASALPANVGVLSFVIVPLEGLDMDGAAGTTVLIVILSVVEAGEVLPALSVAFAVILWRLDDRAVVGVADQVPVLDAVVVAIRLLLS